MRIALAQTASADNLTDNISILKKLICEAAEKDCTVLCLPEAFLTGYSPENAINQAISADKAAEMLLPLAEKSSLDLLTGFMEKDGEDLYITHGIFKPDGEYELYRKTHLGQKEAHFFKAGNCLKVMTLSDGTKFGFQLCVETHFPDVTRTLSLKGAQVIFAPHAVPCKSGNRREIWEKYIPARSYDYRVYMACCNMWGGCMASDPNGIIIASNFENTALLTVNIDPGLCAYYRRDDKHSRRFYPAYRRSELYDI